MSRAELATQVGYQLVEQHLLSGLTVRDCHDIGLVPEGETFEHYSLRRLCLDRSLQPRVWKRMVNDIPHIRKLVPNPSESPYWFNRPYEIEVRKSSLLKDYDPPMVENAENTKPLVDTWIGHFMDQWFEEQEQDYSVGHDHEEYRQALNHLQWINIKTIRGVQRQKKTDSLPLVLQLVTEDEEGEMQPLTMVLTDQKRIERVVNELFSPPMEEFARNIIEGEIIGIQSGLLAKLKKDIDAAAALKREYTEALSKVGNIHLLGHLINRLHDASAHTGGGSLIIRAGEGVNSYEDRLFFRNEDTKGPAVSFYWRDLEQRTKPEFKGARIRVTQEADSLRLTVEKPENLRDKDYDPNEFFKIIDGLNAVHPEAFASYRLSGPGKKETDKEYYRWIKSLSQLSLTEILSLFRCDTNKAWIDVVVSFLNQTPVLRWKEPTPQNITN